MNRIARYELKYTVPPALVPEISAFIAPYCRFDKYSADSPDRLYTVNSLYLDTPRHFFLRQRMEKAEKRFNMRIRSYGDIPKPPYFLEVKHRIGDLIRKYRSPVRGEDVEGAVSRPADDAWDDSDAENGTQFRRLAQTYGAMPQVLIQYRRMAFFSVCDEYARVTFDRALRYAPRGDYSLRPVESEMVHCDVETLFDEGASVILELKCLATTLPLWMIDLVRAFQLRRRGFSKYSSGMSEVLRRYAGDQEARTSPEEARFG